MNTKHVWILMSFILVLALAACSSGPIGTPPGSNSAQTTDLKSIRQLSTTGEGKVYLVPDLAYVFIGVHSEAANVGDSLKANNAQADAIQKSLIALGVDVKDIQTSAFNVYPQQQYDQKGANPKTIYVVDNTVNVTVRDLTKLGSLLDSVVGSGANSIHGIQFDVKDKAKALAEARKQAIDDAKSQAQALAQDAGVQLGALQSLNVNMNNGQPSPVYYAKDAMSVGAGGSVPVSSGQLLITAQANLTYEIK